MYSKKLKRIIEITIVAVFLVFVIYIAKEDKLKYADVEQSISTQKSLEAVDTSPVSIKDNTNISFSNTNNDEATTTKIENKTYRKEEELYSINEIQSKLVVNEDSDITYFNENNIQGGKELKITAIDTFNMEGEFVKTVAFYVPSNAKDFWTNGITHVAYTTDGNVCCNVDLIAKVDDEYYNNLLDFYNKEGYEVKDSYISLKLNETTTTYISISNLDNIVVTYEITVDTSSINEDTASDLAILTKYLNLNIEN